MITTLDTSPSLILEMQTKQNAVKIKLPPQK